MKKRIYFFLFAIFFIAISASSFAQLNINTSMTPAQLVQNVLIQGSYTVSNITYQGTTGSTTSQFGAFTKGNTTNLGLTSGIVLSSGYVNHIPAVASTSGAMSDATGSGSDVDLGTIAGSAGTNDACVLQFDFIPTSNIVSFRYIFGAEEYNEFVNVGSNDVCGIFLSGPDITGLFSNSAVNIALIPGTTLPVAINNVNNGQSIACSTGPCTNCTYFTDNCAGTSIVFGGFTKVLTASHSVIPFQKYHIKIAVADVMDDIYDSGIFLEAGKKDTSLTQLCLGDSVIVSAPAGCSSYLWNTGDTTSSIIVHNPIAGDTVHCTCIYPGDTIKLSAVVSTLPVTGLSANSQTICSGDTAVITASAGYSYLWNTGQTTASISVTPAITNNYTVTATSSGGCTASCSAVVNVNLILGTTTSTLSTCGNNNGTITVTPTIGLSPFTYLWNNAQTTATATALAPGAYTVTITDANGCKGTVSGTVTTNSLMAISVSSTPDYCYESNGIATVFSTGGSGTYTYLWNTSPQQTTATATGLTAGTYTVTVSDGVCTESASVIVTNMTGPLVQFTNIVNATCGYSNGSATAIASGGSTPYTYLWNTSPQQTTQTAIGLAKGTYYIHVTDGTGCVTYDSIYVNCVYSVMEYENISNIIVAPNPSNGVFTLTLQNTPDKNFEIEIFNSLGQSINKDVLNTQTKTIDISHYPNGFYFLKISSEGKYLFKKIIKE